MRTLSRWSLQALALVLLVAACSVASDTAEVDLPVTPDPGLIDDSELPRPATPQERVTATALGDAFEAMQNEPVLQLLQVSATGTDSSGHRTVARHMVTDESETDGFGIRTEGLEVRDDATRRLPAVASPLVEGGGAVPDGPRLEFRTVDGALSSRVVDASAAQWQPEPAGGIDSATNAYHYLRELRRALSGEPLFTTVLPDGTRRVSVEFDTEAIGELATELDLDEIFVNGARVIVFDDVLSGTVELSPDGHVTYTEVDTTRWWSSLFNSFDASDEYLDQIVPDEQSGLYSVSIARVDDVATDDTSAGESTAPAVDPSTALADTADVLVAVTTIEVGTLIGDIVDNPGAFVSVQSIPAELVLAGSYQSLDELRDLNPD